mmetsp:Transcript_1836/g.4516  ORF Transcript_1836/g.4516 Transcript_1836/m.4516 type:complete len:204 (-) Transcript_1836:747-1358(-)
MAGLLPQALQQRGALARVPRVRGKRQHPRRAVGRSAAAGALRVALHGGEQPRLVRQLREHAAHVVDHLRVLDEGHVVPELRAEGPDELRLRPTPHPPEAPLRQVGRHPGLRVVAEPLRRALRAGRRLVVHVERAREHLHGRARPRQRRRLTLQPRLTVVIGATVAGPAQPAGEPAGRLHGQRLRGAGTLASARRAIRGGVRTA